MSSFRHWQEDKLIPKRIPKDQIQLGKVYLIHARNSGIGIATMHHGQLAYTIRRVKFGRIFLFDEIDWEECTMFGTAIPLRELPDLAPENKDEWLDWLLNLEEIHKKEILETWER